MALPATDAVAGLVGVAPEYRELFSLMVAVSTVLVRLKLEEGVPPPEAPCPLFRRGAAEGGPEWVRMRGMRRVKTQFREKGWVNGIEIVARYEFGFGKRVCHVIIY